MERAEIYRRQDIPVKCLPHRWAETPGGAEVPEESGGRCRLLGKIRDVLGGGLYDGPAGENELPQISMESDTMTIP